jgi:hypothetical protein
MHVGDYHDHDHDDVHPPPVFVPSSLLGIPSDRFSLDSFPAYDLLDDSRGSLLLFSMRNSRCRDLIVCEPLTRRYQGILWPSVYLGTSLGVFHCLLDGAGSDVGRPRVGMSNFRILSAFTKTMTCVFSLVATVAGAK